MKAMTIIIFDKDHDPNGLEGYVTRCGLQFISSFDDALASSAQCVFVHVVETDWKKLCDELSRERVALRFTSSRGYPRSLPEGKNGNCFRCLKPTKSPGKITDDEFAALVSAFANSDIVRQLSTSVPDKIRGLVARSTDHRLRALAILLQACMVEWGSTTEHGTEAVSLLRCHPAPSLASERLNRAGLFYRILADGPWADRTKRDMFTAICNGLQQELGVKEFDPSSPFAKLVKDVISAENESATLSWDVCKAVFQELEREPGISRGAGKW